MRVRGRLQASSSHEVSETRRTSCTNGIFVPSSLRDARRSRWSGLTLITAAVCAIATFAQQPAAPRTGKTAAPFDPAGYWVPLITEDWRFRMVTPPKGDYASVPLSAEGRRVADTWDLAKDDGAGNQ